MLSRVLQADEDGIDRFLAVQRVDDADQGVGAIFAEGACRIGRARSEEKPYPAPRCGTKLE